METHSITACILNLIETLSLSSAAIFIIEHLQYLNYDALGLNKMNIPYDSSTKRTFGLRKPDTAAQYKVE